MFIFSKIFPCQNGKTWTNPNNDSQWCKMHCKPSSIRTETGFLTESSVECVQGLSFTARPGEVVALVGPSGGGKTSCVNLLEHFYLPDSGLVLLDGVPIQEYDHKFLHMQVGAGANCLMVYVHVSDRINFVFKSD